MRKKLKKLLSLVLSLVLALTSTIGGLQLITGGKKITAVAEEATQAETYINTTAYTEETAEISNNYTQSIDTLDNRDDIQVSSNGEYTISSEAGFIALAQYANAHSTAGKTFIITSTGAAITLGSSFPGIGSADYPFEGTIISTYPTTLQLNGSAALFRYLSTKASLFATYNELTISTGSGAGEASVASHGGLAQVLIVDEQAPQLSLTNLSINGSVSNNLPSALGLADTGLLFGRVETSVDFTLDAAITVNGTAVSAQHTGSAGSLIGRIEAPGKTVSLNFANGFSLDATVSTANGDAGGLIGLVNGTLLLDMPDTFLNFNGTVTATNGNAGGLMGSVEGVALFGTALDTPESVAISGTGTVTAWMQSKSSVGGAAGMLIGQLASGSALKAGAVSVANTIVRGGKAAGMIVGYSQLSDIQLASVAVSGGEVRGDTRCGGFIGWYTDDEAYTLTDTVAVSGVTIYPVNGCYGSGTSSAGGLFGCADITTGSFILFFTRAAVSSLTVNTSAMKSNNNNLAVGGLLGTFSVMAKTQTVSVSQMGVECVASCVLTGNKRVGSFGGIVGAIPNNAYFVVEDIAVHAESINNDTQVSAAIVGSVGNGAVLACTGMLVPSHKDKRKRAILVAASVGRGASVSLSGSVNVPDDVTATHAMLVKKQNNSLIYCTDGFTFFRGTTAVNGDDIGNYGQVIQNAAIGSLITLDSATHDVTVAKVTGTGTAINNVVDFARLAITLSTQGVFSGYTTITADNYATLLTQTYTLGSSFSLENTGIESLTRSDINSDKFSGTFNGGSHTLTLAIGARQSVSVNSGIFASENDLTSTPHKFLGLFSAVYGATFTDLTLAGNVLCASSNRNSQYIGPFAACAEGAVTVTGSTSSVTMVESFTRNDQNVYDGHGYYGGFFATYSGSSLTMTGNTAAATITSSPAVTGGLVGWISTASGTLNFSNTVLATDIISTITCDYARFGGVVSLIEATGTAAVVTLTGLTSQNTPRVVASSSNSCGGLLGYKWNNVDAEIDGVINGIVANAGTGTFGGLVYEVTGKMVLDRNLTVRGSYTGQSNGTTSQGLIVCKGEQLLLVAKCLYANLSGDSTVLTNTGTSKVDRLVGNTIVSRSIQGAPNHGGVVSIETGEGTGVMPVNAPATAWYSAEQNPNTRYYYNVEALASATSVPATLDSADDVLLWHLVRYTNGQVANFKITVGNGLTISASVNVAGLCLYPTSAVGLTLTFTNAAALTFGLPTGAVITDTASQNYTVQTGLLLDVTGGLTVKNVILSGTVSPWTNAEGESVSGALVTGTMYGTYVNTANTSMKLTLNGITLNNLRISGVRNDDGVVTDYAPLLINKIRSNVNGEINNVSETGYTNGFAGTSLIGKVGEKDSEGNITSAYLNFRLGQIVLKADSTSVFTKATLFDTIYYTSGNSGFNYNFNIAEDWPDTGTPHQVTYGKELTADGTQYYDNESYVSPVTNAVTTPLTEQPYDFTGYLPYVRRYADTPSEGNKLVVNLKSGDLNNGWGTYKHPYKITTANQLIALYTVINDGAANPGWSVNYPDSGYMTAKTYTMNANGSLSSGVTTLAAADLRSWLQEAYFLIDTGEIRLSDVLQEYNGIGTDDYPFHGVISGNNATITLPGNTDLAAGGFIKVANGCVIRGLTINYAGGTTITSNENSYYGGVIGKITGGDNILENITVTGITSENLSINTRDSFVGGYVGWIYKGGLLFRGQNNSCAGFLGEADYDTYYYAAPYVGRVLDGYAFNEGDAPLENTDKNYTVPSIVYAEGDSITYTAGTPTVVTPHNAKELLILASAINGNSLSFNNDNSAYVSTSRVRAAAYDTIGSTSLTEERIDDDTFSTATTVPYLVKTYFSTDAAKWLNNDSKKLCQINLANNTTYDLSSYGNAFRGLGGQYLSTPTLKLNGLDGNGSTVILNMTMRQYYGANLNNSRKYEMYSSGNIGLLNQVAITSANSTMAFTDLNLCGSVSLRYADYQSTAADILCSAGIQVFDVNTNSVPSHLSGGGVCAGGLIGKLYLNGSTENIASDITLQNITLGNGIDSLSVDSQDVAGGIVGYVYEPDHKDGNEESLLFSDCGYDMLTVTGKTKAGGFIGYGRLRNTQIRNTTATLRNGNILVYRSNGAETFVKSATSRQQDIGAGGVIGFCYGNNQYAKYVLTIKDVGVYDTVAMTKVDTPSKSYITSAGGIIGRTEWLSIGISDCTVRDAVILSVCGKFADRYIYSQVPSTALSRLPDEYRRYADWMLSRNSNNYDPSNYFNYSDKYIDGCAGGIIGGTGNNSGDGNMQTQVHAITLRNNTVEASADKVTLIEGYNCAGGLMGDSRIKDPNTTNANTNDEFNKEFPRKAGFVVEGCRVGATASGGPVVILGGTRASGVLAFSNQQSFTMNVSAYNGTHTQIGLAGSATVYILATVASDQSISAGVAGDILGNIKVEDTDVCNANIGGRISGGVSGRAASSTLRANRKNSFNRISVTDCWMYAFSKDTYCTSAGVFAMAAGFSGYTHTIYANDITLSGCRIERSTENATNVGGLVGSQNAVIYGNRILWVNNTLGSQGKFTISNVTGYARLFNTMDSQPALTATHAGVWVGSADALANLQLLAVSRRDSAGAAALKTEVASGEKSSFSIVYASYNAATTSQIDATPSYTAADQTWFGDSVGWVDTTRTPALLNTIDWWKSAVKMDNTTLTATYLKSYADYDAGQQNTTIAGLPLLKLNGDVSTVLPAYLNLITNGGFSRWTANGLSLSVDSRYYTVNGNSASSTLTLSGEGEEGSVAYTGGAFRNGARYDRISAGATCTFTLLTLTFTNSDAVDSTDTYTLHVLVYYPQVLEMETHVVPLGSEDYALSNFYDAPATYQANINADGTVSLYLEYIYNEVRENNTDWNFDKVLRSMDDTLTVTGTAFPKGTQFVLVDLNPLTTRTVDGSDTIVYDSSKYKSYYMQLGAASADIHFSDFRSNEETPATLTYVALSQLHNLVGVSKEGGASADLLTYGIERYLLVARFPDTYTVSESRPDAYYLYADAEESHNVTLERGAKSRGFVTVFAKTKITFTGSGIQTQITNDGLPVCAGLNLTVSYPDRYADAMLAGSDVVDYGVIKFRICNISDDRAVSLPAGTEITILDSTNTVISSSVLSSPRSENSCTIPGNLLITLPNNEQYYVQLDFSKVDPAVFNETFSQEKYRLAADFYLTENASRPESGVKASISPKVELQAVAASEMKLAVNATSESLALGVNKFGNSEDTDITNKGKIAFNVTADFTEMTSSLSNSVLRIHLYRKNAQGEYDPISQADLSSYVAYFKCGGVDITNTMSVNVQADMEDKQLQQSFELQVSPDITYFANYKVEAVLETNTEDGQLSAAGHIIYTVAKIKNRIGFD